MDNSECLVGENTEPQEAKLNSSESVQAVESSVGTESQTEVAKPLCEVKSSGKKEYITFLHVFCAFAVVMLHINNGFWDFGKDFFVANIIECLFYFAVPVFMMISGATLMNYRKRYSTKVYLKKRFERAVVPYIFWTIFALVVLTATGHFSLGEHKIKRIIEAFLNANVGDMSIYYFFLHLFVVYLTIIVLSLIPEDKRKSVFGFLIAYGIITDSILPLAFELLGVSHFNRFGLPLVSGYTIFVLIGYYIDNYEIKKPYRILIYVLGLEGLFLHLYMTYTLSMEAGYIVGTYKGYNNAPCVFYSIAIFTFFKYLDGKKVMSVLAKWCSFFSSTTLGVYLIHRYFMIYPFEWWPWLRYSLAFKLIGGVAIFLISSLIVKLLQKIPFVKKIVP